MASDKIVAVASDIQKDFYISPRSRKNGKPVYYIRFRDPVSREILTARSSGLTNRTAAEKWARAEFGRLTGEALHPPATLEEWAAPFYTETCPHVSRLRLEGAHYSERVRKDHRRILLAYILPDPLAGKRLGDISRGDLLALRDRLVLAHGRTRTVQKALSILKVILREAVFRSVIPADPSAGIGILKVETRERKPISLAEVRRLLEPERWEDEVLRRATATAGYTGMRAGEVRALLWEDLRPKEGIILVHRSLSGDDSIPGPVKWGKARVCPYPAALQALLELHRGDPSAWVFGRSGGHPIGYGLWGRTLKAVATKAGFPRVTLHVLRHSLNTALRGAGAADELLLGAFGWSAPSVQEGYTHRSYYDYSGLRAQIDDLLGGQHGE